MFENPLSNPYMVSPASDRKLLAGKPVQGATNQAPDTRYASVYKEPTKAEKLLQTAQINLERSAPKVDINKPRDLESFVRKSTGVETNLGSFVQKNTGVKTEIAPQLTSMNAGPGYIQQEQQRLNETMASTDWSTIGKEDIQSDFNVNASLQDLTDDMTNVVSEGRVVDIKKLKQLYPEFSGVEDSILEELTADIENVISEGRTVDMNKLKSLYPELSQGSTMDVSKNRFREVSDSETLPYLETSKFDENATVGDFLKNTGKSAWNMVAGIGNMALNPIDSAKAIAKLAIGGAYNLGENIVQFATGDSEEQIAEGVRDNLGRFGDFFVEAGKQGGQVADYFTERYGTKEGRKQALYQDPVGVLSDVASVVSGGAGLVGKGAKLAGLTKTADTLGDISRVANTIDPATQVMRGAGYAAGKSGEYIAKSKPVKWAGEKVSSMLDLTGLSDAEKIKVKSNPYLKDEITKLKSSVEEQGLEPQDHQKQALQSITQELVASVDDQIGNLKQTGPIYEEIKKNPKSFSIMPAKTGIDEILSKYDVKVNTDGKLDFSQSNIGNKSDMNKIQDAYDRIKGAGDTMNAKGVLNMRQSLDDLAGWERATTPKSSAIIKQFRGAIDDVAKNEVVGLAEADKLFSKQITELKDLKKGLTNKEGNVLAGAYSKVKNASTLANTQFAEKLEKYFPGTKEKIDAINDAKILYNKINKSSGQSIKSRLLATGIQTAVAIAVTNTYGGGYGIGAMVLGHILENTGQSVVGKIKKSQIEKIINTVSPEQLSKLDDIGKRLQSRQGAIENDKKVLQDTIEKVKQAIGEQGSKLQAQDIIDSLSSDTYSYGNKGNSSYEMGGSNIRYMDNDTINGADSKFNEYGNNPSGVKNNKQSMNDEGGLNKDNSNINGSNSDIISNSDNKTTKNIQQNKGSVDTKKKAKEIVNTMLGKPNKVDPSMYTDKPRSLGNGKKTVTTNDPMQPRGLAKKSEIGNVDNMKNKAINAKNFDDFFDNLSDKELIDITGNNNGRGILNRGRAREYFNKQRPVEIKEKVVKEKIVNNNTNLPIKDDNILRSVNPTGGILVEYNPARISKMKLGDNITTLDKTMKVSPEKEITIYRGTDYPQKDIVPGDFITTNYDLAKSYSGKGNVISKKVKVSDILDDLKEPLGEEYIYKPLKDNMITPVKKLNDNNTITLVRGEGGANGGEAIRGKGMYLTDNVDVAKHYGDNIKQVSVKNSDIFDGNTKMDKAIVKDILKELSDERGIEYIDPSSMEYNYNTLIRDIEGNTGMIGEEIVDRINKVLEKKGYKGVRFNIGSVNDTLSELGLGDKNAFVLWGGEANKK